MASTNEDYVFIYWVPSISRKIPMKIIQPPYPENFDYAIVFKEFDRFRAMFPDTMVRVEKYEIN